MTRALSRYLLVVAAVTSLSAGHVPSALAMDIDCLLEPHMVVKLGSPIAGVLQSVDVSRGDIVRKGEVVARLDARAEAAAVETARARSEFAGRRVKRNQELYRDDLLSGQEKDEVETEKQMTSLELAERRTALQMRSIRSPIDGVVVERIKAPGEFVQETEIMVLAQIDPLNVEVIMPVSEFGRIRVGTPAIVSAAAPVGGSYDAKVTVVDKVIDAASDTFGVRLEIPNPDLAIPAGLRCSVRFDPDVAE